MSGNATGNTHGNVYIASMNMRGAWAERPTGAVVLNVTSMQAKNSTARLLFSPMTCTERGYKGYACFENYWQSGKIYEGILPAVSRNWWRSQTTGKRRYPAGKGRRVLGAQYGDTPVLDYISSRKQVYVPEYYDLIADHVDLWRVMVLSGQDIVVCDFDGPRDTDGKPICLLVTRELLVQKINYTEHPFGHGYIVAAAILGIDPRTL